MARTTDRRRPRRRGLAGRLAWLGPWLLAGLSTAQAGEAGEAASDTAPSATLRQVVDIARRNKAAELAATAARLAGMPPPTGVPAAARASAAGRTPERLPRLWSLTAAGGHWRAEVLLDGRLHAVDATSGSTTRIGPWRVVGLLPAGLRFEQVAAAGKPPRVLMLPPPGRGASALSYRFGRLPTPADDTPGPGVAGRPGPPPDETVADDAGPEDDAAVRRAAALPMPALPSPSAAAP